MHAVLPIWFCILVKKKKMKRMTFTIAIYLFWEISLLIVLSEMIICVPPEIQMFSDSRSLPPSTGDTRNYANDRSACFTFTFHGLFSYTLLFWRSNTRSWSNKDVCCGYIITVTSFKLQHFSSSCTSWRVSDNGGNSACVQKAATYKHELSCTELN